MRVTFRTTALAAASIFAMAGAAIAQTSATATTDLNLRTGPGPEHQAIGVIPANQSVTVLGCTEAMSWCQVDHEGQTAWAYAEYLDLAGEMPAIGLAEPAPGLAEPAPAPAPAPEPGIAAAPTVPDGMPPEWHQDPSIPETTGAAGTAMTPPPAPQPPALQEPDALTAAPGDAPPPAGPLGTGTTAGVAGGAAAGAVIGGPAGAVVGGAAGGLAAGGQLGMAPGTPAAPQTEPPQHVLQHIVQEPVQPVNLDTEIQVGLDLPAHVTLHPIPDYGYHFAFVNQQRVLVDPQTRQVVYIVG